MDAYATDAIRNVVTLSHSGAGKTALAEAMLHGSGAINRLGTIADGNTVCDYEPEEVDRKSSIQLALAPTEWNGVKINWIDTPGYADFSGEVGSALAAADFAALVISAVDGVEVGAESTWRQAEARGLPRMIVINKMDRENADFYQVLDQIKERLDRRCVPFNLPDGAETAFGGVVGLSEAGGAVERFDEFHEQLVEAAAESEDALTEKYLEEGGLTSDEILQGLKLGVASGTIFPVVATSATKQIGVAELLDLLKDYAPSPVGAPPVRGQDASGGAVEVSPNDDGPLAALVFKTTADPYVGKLSFFKVCRNTLRSDSQVVNVRTGQTERIGQVFVPRGKSQENVPSLAPGDIGAVAKLQDTSTGDTLAAKDGGLRLETVEFGNPVYSVSLAPKTKADMDKMGAAIVRVVDEDPSLRMTREQATGETVLSGLGDAHIDVAIKRLQRKFGVEVIVGTPRVPYRETVTTKTAVEYKHKKQSGGHGQYGHVYLELEPLPKGSGLEFATRVVGGSVPREYFPAVEKGVMEAARTGVISGSPVVDLKVTLFDGSSHSVDSSGMAFQIAASQAFKKGLQEARPVILEPVMKVAVTVPDVYTGDVMGDLNGKRAKVLGMNPGNGTTTIDAEAPLAEMQRYAQDLRSIAQGRGAYSMEFSHYEELPAHLVQKLQESMAAQES